MLDVFKNVPYILMEPLLHFIRDPVGIIHVKSKINFRRDFVDILTAGTGRAIVGDLKLIQRNKAIEFLLIYRGLQRIEN